MNIKTIVAALALTVAFAAPAMAGSFSFNKSSADEMMSGRGRATRPGFRRLL